MQSFQHENINVLGLTEQDFNRLFGGNVDGSVSGRKRIIDALMDALMPKQEVFTKEVTFKNSPTHVSKYLMVNRILPYEVYFNPEIIDGAIFENMLDRHLSEVLYNVEQWCANTIGIRTSLDLNVEARMKDTKVVCCCLFIVPVMEHDHMLLYMSNGSITNMCLPVGLDRHVNLGGFVNKTITQINESMLEAVEKIKADLGTDFPGLDAELKKYKMKKQAEEQADEQSAQHTPPPTQEEQKPAQEHEPATAGGVTEGHHGL